MFDSLLKNGFQNTAFKTGERHQRHAIMVASGIDFQAPRSRPRPLGSDRQRLFIKRAVMVLLPIGIMAGIGGSMILLKVDPTPLLRHTNKLTRAVGRHGLWLVRSMSPASDWCEGGRVHTRLQPPQPGANPCLSDTCRVNEYVAWDEWKACKSQQLIVQGWAADQAKVASTLGNLRNESVTSPRTHVSIGTTESGMSPDGPSAFDTFIVEYKDYLPWQGSNFTAVFLEFRFLEGPLTFSINNVMNNLPVDWRIQVIGGSTLCNGTRQLFPAEVAAGKIVLTDMGDRPMQQVHFGEPWHEIV